VDIISPPGKIKNRKLAYIVKNYHLYLFLLPAVTYFGIFNYGPMYGIQLAFKDFIASKGIWGSPWVGFKHFEMLFSSYYFWDLLKNTIGISVYSLIAGFPMPIILALVLNEVDNKYYKKIVQTTTYAPYFISQVVMVGIILLFIHPNRGPINLFLDAIGFEKIDFINKPKYFKSIYVWSGVWKSTGWSSIIYFAVLSSVDPTLHEAAKIDGASRLQRVWHINVPAIIPTAVILFILNTGHIMDIGFEKIYLLQTDLNISASDVISTYIYRVGLLGSRFSFSTAVGLFNNVINLLLLLTVNVIAKRVSSIGLW